MLDLISNDLEPITVEIMPEVGMPGNFKLYVHRAGMTLVRVCKLDRDHIDLLLPRVE